MTHKTIKLTNVSSDDLILAIRAARSFANTNKPIGFRHGTFYGYKVYDEEPEIYFYVYQTKTMIVVKGS